MAAPIRVGKSLAMNGPETIASIALLPLRKDHRAIDPFDSGLVEPSPGE